jgi:hypothetical protein
MRDFIPGTIEYAEWRLGRAVLRLLVTLGVARFRRWMRRRL